MLRLISRTAAAAAAVTALLLSDTLALSSSAKPKFFGGAGVGRLNLEDLSSLQISCLYDMVLVERIQGRPRTESGLFVPQEDLPKLHLCKVVSVGPGREEENGMIAPMPSISAGDIVIAKNPWGIGPKDEETSDGRKFSFMRSQDIAAIVTGGIEEFEPEDGPSM